MEPKKDNKEALSSEQMAALIFPTSGHDLHLRTALALRSAGWDVTVSPYYSDPNTNLSREIDIIATKRFTITDKFNEPTARRFQLRLFIECKYITAATMFWFEPRDKNKTLALIKSADLLQKIPESILEGDTSEINKHHYTTYLDSAKLWEKYKPKQNDRNDPDPFYQAMNGCLHSLVFKQQYPEFHDSGTPENIDYPLIVVNSFDKLFRRDTTAAAGYEKINSDFQIEVNYSYLDQHHRPTSKYFIVDVASEESLGAYLANLEASDAGLCIRYN